MAASAVETGFLTEAGATPKEQEAGAEALDAAVTGHGKEARSSRLFREIKFNHINRAGQ